MIFAVNTVGNIGLVKDTSPHELVPTAWTAGENVNFVDNAAGIMRGYTGVAGSASVAPYSFLSALSGANFVIIYMGLDKIYSYNGSVHTNITRQSVGVDVDYTGTDQMVWTSCLLGGLPIMNNGADVPQVWPLTGKAQDLTNWPSTLRAKVVRGYKQFLVALNLTKGDVSYPFTLKWSHPADPGTVPISWDETDVTRDSGEYTFSEGNDRLVDCAPLNDTLVVYKDSSVWGMQYIGGVSIFRFYKMFGTFGALSVNCAVEFRKGQHCVFSKGDIIVHDGQKSQSILSGKLKYWLFKSLNASRTCMCFLTIQPQAEEVWICFPADTAQFATIALIWNWTTGTFGIKTLPNVAYMQPGSIEFDTAATTQTWNLDTDTWELDGESWAEREFSSASYEPTMVSPPASAIYRVYQGFADDGSAQVSFLERTGLGIPFKQNTPPDFTSMKFIQNVFPRILGTLGGVVLVTVGVQQTIAGDVTWGTPQPFIIGTTKQIDVFMSGRLLAIRFSSSTIIEWKLLGYEVDVSFGGSY